jgi:hypothetical protein
LNAGLSDRADGRNGDDGRELRWMAAAALRTSSLGSVRAKLSGEDDRLLLFPGAMKARDILPDGLDFVSSKLVLIGGNI